MVRIKVCGVTTVSDALMCVTAGVDAIGLNFWPRSVRRCDEEIARQIVQAVMGKALVVGVFVDAALAEVERIRDQVGLGCVQLHGSESPEMLAHFLPHAYKALRVRGPSVREEAARFGGEYVLLDAYVPGVPGGTGATFDWALASELARERKVTLAGGITPENAAEAARKVRPFCIDTASGVESAPGVKDKAMVEALVRELRSVSARAAF